jgi:Arc/MetJ family transcription regulator
VRTNIVLDDQLVREAMRVSGLKTKRAVVEAGLRLLVQTKAQAGMRRLRGKVAWEGDLQQSRAARVRAI